MGRRTRGIKRKERNIIETQVTTSQSNFRRLATASVFASLFAYAAVLTVTPAAINQVIKFYHASDSQTGRLYGIMMLGFFVALMIGGRHSDKRGKLPLIALGNLLMGIGVLAFAKAASFNVAFAAMLIMGIGSGLSEGLCMALISDLYGEARRTAMMNCSQFIFALVAVVVPLSVAKLLQSHVDWRVAYLAICGVCTAATLVTFGAAATRNEKPLTTHEAPFEWRAVLSDRLVLLLSIGILLYVGAECGQANWMARYFKYDLHSSGPLAAASVAFFWGGIGLGRMTAAFLSKHMSDVSIIRTALACAAVCQIILLSLKQPALAILMVGAVGFCLGPIWPTILSRAGSAHPHQTGTVIGIIVSCGAIGGGVFPWAIGAAADVMGMHRALWLCLVLLILNLALFTHLRRREVSAKTTDVLSVASGKTDN